LAFESLEKRVVLDGQLMPPWTAAAGISPPPSDGVTAVSASISATSSAAGFDQFASPEALEKYLLDAAVRRWGALFGQPVGWWWPWPAGAPGGPTVTGDAPPATGAEDSPSGPYGANVQVAGVEEGDILKTDGMFLYRLGQRELTIIDARDPSAMSVASRIELGQFVSEIYLTGNRLTLISQSPGLAIVQDGAASGFAPPALDWQPVIEVSVYDVADRTSPRLVERTEIDGQLIASRAIGDIVYLVAQEDIGLPMPEIHCGAGEPAPVPPTRGGVVTLPIDPGREAPQGAVGGAPSTGSEWVYETQQEYIERWTGHVLEASLPAYRASNAAGDVIASGWLHQVQDVYEVDPQGGSQLVSIVALNVSDDDPRPIATTAAFTGFVAGVYVAPENLYLASPCWEADAEATTIYQFAMAKDPVNVAPVAFGEVPGRILNQFSMDEKDGYLRLATTQGWGQDATNHLFVLQPIGNRLETIGQLNDLAPGETIYAARFLGDQAFLVTFRFVDPLLAIDLSDPTAPQVAGQLTIPGFSNYLQMVQDGYLVGLGRDADDDSGWVRNPQLSLFDVTDLQTPSLVDRFLIEQGGWGMSEALYDHHAFSYFPEKGILVLPFYCAGWDFPETGLTDRMACQPSNEFWVFQLDPQRQQDAILLLGRIEHPSLPRRSLRIGEVLFTISDDTVKAHDLDDPTIQLGELRLAENADRVRIRLVAVDAEGAPIDWVSVGEEFQVNVLVEDLRDPPKGVVSAYVDVWYDSTCVAVTAAISPGGDFADGRSGDTSTPGLVDEVGGLATGLASGGGEHLLASLRFVATAPGLAAFSADAADQFPTHETYLCDDPLPVDPSSMEFHDIVVQAVDSFHNPADPTDTNGDGRTSPLDALAVINCLNGYGSQSTQALQSLAMQKQAQGVSKGFWLLDLDVNADQSISPIDALLVINRLNQASDGEAGASVSPCIARTSSIAPSASRTSPGFGPLEPGGNSGAQKAADNRAAIGTGRALEGQTTPVAVSASGQGLPSVFNTAFKEALRRRRIAADTVFAELAE
jgi:hypothetical protein